jgi:chromosome segregation ATPase
VVCRCRPDQHRWRAFGLLSGGQKALSTLALVLALQAALPSAFYFFDEVREAERLC